LAPIADLAHRLADIAGRGDDRSLQPVGIGAADLGHIAVIGADQTDLERYIRQADDARPDRRHQEMHVRALGIHIQDAIVGTVIDDTRARPPLAAPHTPVAGAGPRLRFAQPPLLALPVAAVGRPGPPAA